ncbi:hypothetical protein Q8A64_07980 [Oxalobacteraceae bacterium R-40]|uniref:Uncharacterized protein n=1 Tax=Keguizhuia sedimenti TaxID=3064264 RepID=A0ABU1BMX7_9BURK|nr:hypothetical protein [Oxalobacteraceae bacterium R-40]
MFRISGNRRFALIATRKPAALGINAPKNSSLLQSWRLVYPALISTHKSTLAKGAKRHRQTLADAIRAVYGDVSKRPVPDAAA